MNESEAKLRGTVTALNKSLIKNYQNLTKK